MTTRSIRPLSREASDGPTIEYAWREPSAFVPASDKATEEIKRLAPSSDAALPMLAAVNEDRRTEIGAPRVA